MLISEIPLYSLKIDTYLLCCECIVVIFQIRLYRIILFGISIFDTVIKCLIYCSNSLRILLGIFPVCYPYRIHHAAASHFFPFTAQVVIIIVIFLTVMKYIKSIIAYKKSSLSIIRNRVLW